MITKTNFRVDGFFRFPPGHAFICLWAIIVVVLMTAQTMADNLEWVADRGFRSAAVRVEKSGKTGFSRLEGKSTGILFTNYISAEQSITNSPLNNGSGLAAEDVDGDGLCDLYFCGLENANVLYRNLGNGRFEDITARAGVSCAGQFSTGAVLGDVDGDGDPDLLVNGLGAGTRLFFNDGKGIFTEQKISGLIQKGGSMALALADIDGDGALDLYVSNFRPTVLVDEPGLRFTVNMVNGKPQIVKVNGMSVATPHLTGRFSISPSGVPLEHGEPDTLFRNSGNGHFIPVSWTDGTFVDEDGKPLSASPFDWGLGIIFRDLNGDGSPDLYVCNDSHSKDAIWINNGKGHFQAIPRLAIRKTSLSSMGVDVADINRDGFDDLLVVDMLSRDHQKRHTQTEGTAPQALPIGTLDNRPQYPRNTLQLNRGDGSYAEIAELSGLDASEWSWTPIFLDVDLDGFEDVLISNGFPFDVRDADAAKRISELKLEGSLSIFEQRFLRRFYPGYASRSLAFRNQQDLTFKETGRAWGLDQEGVSHGMALADLDNDGDMDVVMNNLNGETWIYRNESDAPRVAVRLKGKTGNTRGIGAKIWVFGGAVPMQSQEMICGGRYLSSDQPMRVFAAGNVTNRMRLEIKWRSGKRSVVDGAKANRIYEVDEAGAVDEDQPEKPKERPLFEDVSRLLKHKHHEQAYDDFARQPLLPRKLSQLGPGVSWYDLDGDGREDLIVGSGKGGELGIYLNKGERGFEAVSTGTLIGRCSDDQTTILGWAARPGEPGLLIGQANYESGGTNNVTSYGFWAGGMEEGAALSVRVGSTGPLALGDIDGDGDLDLFVGGRFVPGRYPEAASSWIHRNEGGKFEQPEEWKGLGLVSGAVWSDLNGDGYPELLLACEWGPLRVLRNENGRLKDVTKELGLDKYVGWWNGVTTGDFDQDGRMDIVAGNWGRNTKYEHHREQPARIYFGDFNGNGSVELMEAYFAPETRQVVPWRSFNAVSKAMPWVKERFGTHSAYAGASVAKILGEQFKLAKELTASVLESMVFLNRGDHFEGHALPLEAQLAPCFGVCAGDLDGDGNEDVFLSQNFFAVDAETSRYDAGRGVFLTGDGKGGFVSKTGKTSGIEIYGEGRGSALSDFDGDGRIDLAVAQNGAQTKLYHNLGAKPGLRVRLAGSGSNPTGIGAQLKLKYGARSGPVRELHAGSGYWSQDGAVTVLGMTDMPTALWVRWPGGQETTADLPAGAREITLTQSGELKINK